MRNKNHQTQTWKRGTRVRKISGDTRPSGTVLGEFETLRGLHRVVVELDYAELLHIYSPEQLQIIPKANDKVGKVKTPTRRKTQVLIKSGCTHSGIKYKSAAFCDHANECPTSVCKCPVDCSCRQHMCGPVQRSVLFQS